MSAGSKAAMLWLVEAATAAVMPLTVDARELWTRPQRARWVSKATKRARKAQRLARRTTRRKGR